MHSLEEGVDVKGIQKVFHGYGDVLECKPQVPKFEKAKQGLWFLEARQSLLFLVSKPQNHIASRILLAIH